MSLPHFWGLFKILYITISRMCEHEKTLHNYGWVFSTSPYFRRLLKNFVKMVALSGQSVIIPMSEAIKLSFIGRSS